MAKCPSCYSERLEDLGTIIACDNCGYTIKKDVEPRFKLYIVKLLFIFPIVLLFFIIFAFGFFSVTEVFTYNNYSFSINTSEISVGIADKLLVYFFIMLALVDFGTLILQEYVRPLLFPPNEPPLELKYLKHKMYLEKLMVFGIIIIVLDTFSKIFTSKNQDSTNILIGVSLLLISISIWKYLSLKAEHDHRG